MADDVAQWSTVKMVLENMIKGVLAAQNKRIRTKAAAFLRKLADDIDTETTKEADTDAT